VTSGSAFCIDSTGAAGLFVTNHHVIKDAGKGDKITVVLAPGTPGERRLEATRGQG
jgi:S1-C subfamily serine protease